MNSSHLILAFIVSFFIIVTKTNGEVITYEMCKEESACQVHEVRLEPCKEAARRKPCKLKRGKSANFSMEFTPTFGADKVISKAFWHNGAIDLPFEDLDSDGCKTMTCPMEKDKRTVYNFSLEINRKYPASTYEVKWKISDESGKQCCILISINITK